MKLLVASLYRFLVAALLGMTSLYGSGGLGDGVLGSSRSGVPQRLKPVNFRAGIAALKLCAT
jgi:hypothetical protein